MQGMRQSTTNHTRPHYVQFRISEELRQRLDDEAERRMVSRQFLINRAIELLLEDVSA